MTDEKLVEVRLAHLNLIQGVIVRLAGYSANAKNFCVTILVALIAIAFQKPTFNLYFSSILVIIVFALMDAYYLALERRFRDLFETVSAQPIASALEITLMLKPLNMTSFFRALGSSSIWIMYGFLLVASVPFLYGVSNVQKQPDKPFISCNYYATLRQAK